MMNVIRYNTLQPPVQMRSAAGQPDIWNKKMGLSRLGRELSVSHEREDMG
jgi:hypothetical protein